LPGSDAGLSRGGLNNHESPWIAEGSDDRLSENMVVSIEPGVYLPGLGGFRHSDMVLVTKDGHEVLTRMPTCLDTLVLRSWKPLARIKGRVVRRALGRPTQPAPIIMCRAFGRISSP
jgi:hypothetical protein